jgi:hypothetical protein
MAFGVSTSFDMDAILRADTPSTNLMPPLLERQQAVGPQVSTGLGLPDPFIRRAAAGEPPATSRPPPFGDPVLPRRMPEGEPSPFGFRPSTPEPDINLYDCIRVLRTIVETRPVYLVAKYAYLGIAACLDRMIPLAPSSSSSAKFGFCANTLRSLAIDNPPIHVHKATLIGIITDLDD